MENIRTFVVLIAMPVVCTGRFLLSFVAKQEREKTWRRVLVDSVFRWVLNTHPLPRLALFSGSSEGNYIKWAKRSNMKTYIEEIGENAKLFWILDEKLEGKIPSRVILYLHGGGFYLPLMEDAGAFWYHVQKELKDRHGMDVAIAILDYTLIPEAHFPVPLRQAAAAIQHLRSRGVKPENLILTGDSAGGNLTLQVLLHVLHPLEGVPKIEASKFAGAYLMSPWLTLLPREKRSQECFRENGRWDVISPGLIDDFGRATLSGIKDDQHLPYIDYYFAPAGWYDDMGTITKEVLITAGRYECFREDIIDFAQKVENEVDVQLIVDKYGVHDDPLFDFIGRESKLGDVTVQIISWCHKMFT